VNFLLKNIELAIDEADLLVGEKLFEEQKVTTLYESERNLWVALVDGFETEVQISPTKVKACSCECDVFVKRKMCGHVTASLLALRRRLSEKANAPKKGKAHKSTYTKLTINSILDQVGQEELAAFIRHYSKRNRHFSIAFKTRFASAVPMADSIEKYRQVVDLVTRSSRNKNGELSASGLTQVLACGRDLLGQANDSIALEHFVEGWAVYYVLLDRVVQLVNKVARNIEEFVEFTDQVFEGITTLLSLPVPPSLREDIWKALLQNSNRPAYRGFDRAVPILRILLVLSDDFAKRNQLLEVVDQELNKERGFSKAHTRQLLVCKLDILSRRGFSTKSKAFFKKTILSSEEVLFTVETAVESGMLKQAKLLANQGLKLFPNAMFQYRLKAQLLEAALQENDHETVVRYSKDCFAAGGNIRFFKLCKEHLDGDWKAFMGTLVKEVMEQNPKTYHRILASLFVEDQAIDQLGKVVREMGSLDFLMKYDRHFLPKHQALLESIYLELLDNYLSNHIGLKPTRKILEIFAHLRKEKAPLLITKLEKFIRQKYPQRMELAIELLGNL